MFTKGPWKINNNIGHKGELGIIADTAPCIIAIMGNQKMWPAEAEANAHLIAGAPDLLEACKAAFERLTDNDMVALGSYELTKQLAQAIAKAEGREKP